MIYSIKSPSETHQNLGVIISSSLILGTVSSSIVINATWSLHTPWPDLIEHLELIKSLIDIHHFDLQITWQSYIDYLSSNNWYEEFILHLTLPSLFSFYASSLLSVKLFYVEGGRKLQRHIQGVKMFVGNAAKKHARKKLVSSLSLGAKKGLKLHPDVQITQKAELGNILTTGKPGSGKTVFILSLISQIINKNVKVLIFDQKGEMTEKFFENKNSILIAPWDKRGIAWNIARDLELPGAALNFAKHVIPETSDPIWSQASQLILAGMIITLQQQNKPWGWKELYKMILVNDLDLRKFLKKYSPEALRFVEENNKTTQSIMMTLHSQLGWIKWLATAWPNSHKNSFSINDWVHQDSHKTRLIVQGNKRYSEVGGPLCQAIMSILCDEYLLMKTHSPCYWVLDELAHFPKSRSLPQWLELSRERGGRTIAGTQSISQLKKIYGDHETDTMLSMFSNQAVFKVSSLGETATFVSKSLGEQIVATPQFTNDNGVRKMISVLDEKLPTVHPFNITELPDPSNDGVKGFLSINGWSATYKLLWPYPKLINITEKLIPAEWTLKKQMNPQSKRRTRISRQRIK
jgi:hypothetical protein